MFITLLPTTWSAKCQNKLILIFFLKLTTTNTVSQNVMTISSSSFSPLTVTQSAKMSTTSGNKCTSKFCHHSLKEHKIRVKQQGKTQSCFAFWVKIHGTFLTQSQNTVLREKLWISSNRCQHTLCLGTAQIQSMISVSGINKTDTPTTLS